MAHGAHAAHESPPVMLVPLAVLALGATFAGIAFRYLVHRRRLRGVLAQLAVPRPGEPHPRGDGARAGAGLAVADPVDARRARWSPTTCTSSTGRRRRGSPNAFPALYRFLLNKWYFDELYDFLFVRPAFAIGRAFWKGGDGAIIDGFGPDGVSARVLDVDPQRRASADRLRLSLRLRDAARRRCSRDLVSVRWSHADVRLLDPLGPSGAAADRRAVHPVAAGRQRGDQAKRALDCAVRDADHLRA